MSQPRMRKPRPLGSLRHINKTAPDKLPAIPKILPDISADNEKLKEGIHGNAMTVPPPPVETHSRESNRRPSDDRPRSDLAKYPSHPPKSSGSSESVVSHENCEKEIKDSLSREKDLKDQISLLLKQISELKVALRGKEGEVETLRETIEAQGKEYEAKLSAERYEHEETKSTLDKTVRTLQERNNLIERMGLEHAQVLEAQKKEMEEKMAKALAEKNAEIADKDQKLSRLKGQMAEALKGNSWERQQQLEELTKELSRIQEESDLLRMRIKSMSKNKQGNCSNCEDLTLKLGKMQGVLKEKDTTIKDMKSLCSKFETQLSTQDKLLEQWASTQGHKITAPK